MAGTALGISLESDSIQQLQARLARLAGLASGNTLLTALGAEIESQTRRRIADEKTTPAGADWPDWSEGYAATRHSGHSLLQSGGELLGSIQQLVSGDTVEVGSNLIYAALHQHGGEPVGIDVPAREWLGLSGDNLADLHGILTDWTDNQLAEAFA